MNILRRLFGSNKPTSTLQRESSLLSTASSVNQVPAPVISPGEELEDPNPETLRKALNIFIFQKITMAEKREMLHNTPLLLAPEAVTMCQEIARDIQGQHVILVQGWESLAALLQMAREQGIDGAMDEWESIINDQVNIDLYPQWLSTSTHRDERRFLQHHPEMLTDTLEISLQVALELIRQNEMLTPQQRQERVEAGYQRLYVVRDIRARISRLQGSELFSNEASLANQTILEGYVNWKGGFMLDLPSWLEKTNQKSQALQRGNNQLFQTATSRAALWKKALKRAQREGLAAEIIAEIAHRIWDALDDIADNQSTAQEEGLQYLGVCLQVYTEERYPYRWAKAQNNLGATYYKRIRREKSDNLEEAIICCSAALRVYTEDTLPFEWARTQGNLGHAYVERIQGNKADNIEQAIACLTTGQSIFGEDALTSEWADIQNSLGAAYLYRTRGNTYDNLERAIVYFTTVLRVYTEDALPLEWARTQNNLGNAYVERIKGDKADNIEQAIACFSASLRIHTEDTLPSLWATIQNDLGSAYLNRIKEDKADNIEQAIACFSASLRIHTEDTLSSLWAQIQNNLGMAYWNRIKEDKADNIEQAIACCTAALRVYTEDTSLLSGRRYNRI